MKILLMRHGEAFDNARSDFERRLTPRGIAGVKSCSSKLVLSDERSPRVIVSSPYPRARETAELMREGFGSAQHIHLSDAIRPDSPPEEALAELGQLLNHQSDGEVVSTEALDFLDGESLPGDFLESDMLIVTHQPLISRLIQRLTGERIAMAPANLVIIQGPEFVAGFCSVQRIVLP